MVAAIETPTQTIITLKTHKDTDHRAFIELWKSLEAFYSPNM